MGLGQILVFLSLSILIGLLASSKWRSWAILILSVLGIYWLQPATPLRHLDFWFPTASVGLSVLVWHMVVTKKDGRAMEDLITSLVILGLMLAVGLTRYLGKGTLLTPTRPPFPGSITLSLLMITGLGLLITQLRKRSIAFAPIGAGLVLVCFVLLKSRPLAETVSRGIRSLSGQSTDLASFTDLSWLGFSYIAFRLLHVLRDHTSGRLPPLLLREFMSYVLFFPALPAGPIDRVERFQQDFNAPARLTSSTGLKAGTRLILGVFKKFVLADGLAYFALSALNAPQVTSSLWLWIMLYTFGFRIYLDFSGYTDVAIGMGLLVGIRLPENFDRPYLKPNLTAFWNSWHITLAQWFRAYFFNPVTRALRSSKYKLPTWSIVLIGQVSTMGLIGLWHGISWSYLLWGLWHGFGLFLHNRWVALQRARPDWFPQHLMSSQAAKLLSVAFTFHFVLIGWIPFVIPEVGQVFSVFLRLFGV